jgi:hypothetical protein
VSCNSLLITTSFSFLKLNVNDGAIHRLHQGDGLYYGITRSPDNIFVAARRRLVSSDMPQEEERGVILVFDNNLQQVDTIVSPFPLRDMHEIKWIDNQLWIVCSFDDMIAILDGKTWHRWYPLGMSQTGIHDRYHFNSLMFENKYVWILAHKRGPSNLLLYDVNTHQLLDTINLGEQSHNIWKYRGEILTCSSGTGQIVGSKGFNLTLGGFPRGVAYLNRNLYIGISALAERKERDFTSGYILVYDEHWQLKKRIDLPKEGLILDIMPFAGYKN